MFADPVSSGEKRYRETAVRVRHVRLRQWPINI